VQIAFNIDTPCKLTTGSIDRHTSSSFSTALVCDMIGAHLMNSCHYLQQRQDLAAMLFVIHLRETILGSL